jgi:hypothetical protein
MGVSQIPKVDPGMKIPIGDAGFEGNLVLVFTKSQASRFFRTRAYHTDVELVLVNSPPPQVPLPGHEGVDTEFSKPALLVHVDRMLGVTHCTSNAERFRSISSEKNNLLSIPLDPVECKNVIDFLYAMRGVRYNHLDFLLSIGASILPMQDVTIDKTKSVQMSVTSVHAPQLASLTIRHCMNDRCRAVVKLWGFNSRFTTANDLYERLRLTCTAVDADRLSRGMLRALSEGVQRL